MTPPKCTELTDCTTNFDSGLWHCIKDDQGNLRVLLAATADQWAHENFGIDPATAGSQRPPIFELDCFELLAEDSFEQMVRSLLKSVKYKFTDQVKAIDFTTASGARGIFT